jgi:hypothetical protein
MGDVVFSNFGDVLKHLKQSPLCYSAARRGWNGKGQFIMLQVPDENSKMGLPYIYITTVEGKRVPWLASQTDMLAEDWILLSSGNEVKSN